MRERERGREGERERGREREGEGGREREREAKELETRKRWKAQNNFKPSDKWQ